MTTINASMSVRRSVMLALLGLLLCSGCGLGQAGAIKRAATRDLDWRAGDVEVSAVEGLDRNGCAFYP
jgi:hypothetical protein